ncbi:MULTISPECIES: SigE family RNA polymerase sigma factor [unclassified Nonomuraea]|uniref:SigE family RNA polymerase sigma factor n=1 Tax=Nonomuraea sp. NPDC003804 TaxID=3154547 RepID=UPI0033BBFF33
MRGFQEFVAARGPSLSRTAFLLTGDHHAAADLLQDTLVKAAARWRRIAESGNPEAYIRTIMLNQLRSWRRPRRLAFFSTSEVPETVQPDPSGGTDSKVMLARALARLGAKQRAVLYLRFYEDLSEAEIARQLGCSVGTVKRHTHDALKRLRQLAPELLEVGHE